MIASVELNGRNLKDNEDKIKFITHWHVRAWIRGAFDWAKNAFEPNWADECLEIQNEQKQ